MTAMESTVIELTAGLANSPTTVWAGKEFVDHGDAGSDKEAGHNIGILGALTSEEVRGKAVPKRRLWADVSEESDADDWAADTVAPSSGTRTPASTADSAAGSVVPPPPPPHAAKRPTKRATTEAHTEVTDSEDDPEVPNSAEDDVDDAAAATAAKAAPAAAPAATASQTARELRLEYVEYVRLEIRKLCPKMAAGRASVFIKESEKREKLFLPTQLCKFYHAGCCTKGDCLYAHGLDEIHPDYSASAQERKEEFHLHSGPEGSGEGYRVNVSNLAYGVNADDLKTLFKKYGEVLDAKIQLRDGVCNGTGNVTFKTKEEARSALAQLNTKRNFWISAGKPLNVFVPPERQEDDDKKKGGKPRKNNNKTGRNPKMSPKVVPQMQQQQLYFCCWTGVWWPVPVCHPSMN